jgi:hypothetical protein
VYGRHPTGKLFLRRRPDKAVGYVDNLYALRPESQMQVLNYSQDAIEKEFFSKVDNDAAVVHAKLVASGVAALSNEDRQRWALFLNSLLERSPRRIEELRNALPALIEKRKSEWEQSGRAVTLKNIDVDALAQNTLLLILVRYIKDTEFINYVAGLEWRVLHLPENSEDHFLTSDSPLIVNGGTSKSPVRLLSIALTPTSLLVIHQAAPEFDSEFLLKLAMMHGFQVIRQAERNVFSSREIRDGKRIKYLKGVENLLVRTKN